MEASDDVDAPEASVISQGTTGDIHRDGTIETNEDQIEVREDSIYGDLPDRGDCCTVLDPNIADRDVHRSS